MSRDVLIKEMLEKLASLEHDQWCCWAGSLLEEEKNLTPERTERWINLINKSYNELSEEQKEQDRIWARKVCDIVFHTLKNFFIEYRVL